MRPCSTLRLLFVLAVSVVAIAAPRQLADGAARTSEMEPAFTDWLRQGGLEEELVVPTAMEVALQEETDSAVEGTAAQWLRSAEGVELADQADGEEGEPQWQRDMNFLW